MTVTSRNRRDYINTYALPPGEAKVGEAREHLAPTWVRRVPPNDRVDDTYMNSNSAWIEEEILKRRSWKSRCVTLRETLGIHAHKPMFQPF